MPALPAPKKRKKHGGPGAARKEKKLALPVGALAGGRRSVPAVALYIGTAVLLLGIPFLWVWISNW